MRLILSMLLALTLLLAACKSSKIVADAPDEIKPSQTIPLTLSTVNVPLSIDIRQIANMLNRQFQGEVYKDDNIEDDNLKMSIIKTGDIAMQAVNNKIVFSIPMHVWAEGRAKWDPCSFCPSISKTQDVTFDVTVRTESQVNLTEDWKLKTNTTASYTWGNTKPALVIGPISIPISYAIDLALKPFMKDVNTMIDKQMAPYLDLASYVKTAWTSVQEPVLINQDMSLWLKISPQEVRLSPLTFQNNNVNMTMGLKSYVQMMSGSKPMYTVNSDLPKLIIDKGIQDNLQIGLQGTISYDKATEMAKNEVAGKVYSFENGKYNVKVNDLTINPLGDKLQVKVDLSSANKKGKVTNGIVYVEGTPYYDVQTQSVKVKNFDYNLKSKNLLLKSAAWLVNKTFLSQIEEKLDFPMNEYIHNAELQAQETLKNGTRINDMALLKGSLSSITPQGIYVTPNGIVALVDISGHIQLLVDKL